MHALVVFRALNLQPRLLRIRILLKHFIVLKYVRFYNRINSNGIILLNCRYNLCPSVFYIPKEYVYLDALVFSIFAVFFQTSFNR